MLSTGYEGMFINNKTYKQAESNKKALASFAKNRAKRKKKK